MMIPPPSAGDPFQAAAALDRALRSPGADSDTPSDSTLLESGPDVVVTLSKPSAAPATYNASGKLSGSPSLGDMGAKAAESGGDDDASSDATPASTSASSPDASVGVGVDEEATAAA